MGTRTLGAFRSELQLRTRNRTDVTTVRFNLIINEAILAMAADKRLWFPEIERVQEVWVTTTAGTRAYTLPTDTLYVLSLRDMTNTRKLQQFHFRVLDRITQVRGLPSRYCRFGSTVELDPIPDGAYDLRLRDRRRPVALVSDADVQPFADEWEEALYLKAAEILYRAVLDEEMAGQTTANYKRYVDPLILPAHEEYEDADVAIVVGRR